MSKWIDCKEEMPPESAPLLIVWKGVVQHLTYTLYGGEWYAHHEDPDECLAMEDGLVTVTHWMPLPAPPTLAVPETKPEPISA